MGSGKHINCKEKVEVIQFFLASEKVQVQILVLFLKQFYFFSSLVPYLKKYILKTPNSRVGKKIATNLIILQKYSFYLLNAK